MTWRKASYAARRWAGDVNPKILYAAHAAGKLKAAHIGAGRNLLFCKEWIDEWLIASAERTPVANRVSPAKVTPIKVAS